MSAWRSLVGVPRRTRWRLGGALVVSLALVAAWRGCVAAEGEWVRVVRADLVLGAEITGTLRATRSSQIGPPPVADVWEFKIASLAQEGAKVTKDTPVLGFDTSELQRELERKTAERDSARKQIEKTAAQREIATHDDTYALAQAEAELRKARLKNDRPPELVADRLAREAALDLALAERRVAFLTRKIALARRAAEAELSGLRARERRAATRVEDLERAITRMTVVAPRDGTVIYLSNWRDEKKKVGDTCWRMERVLEIPDLSEMMARAEIDEVDAGRVATGQRVTLRLDALPDVEFTGRIAEGPRVVERKSWENPTRVVRLDVTLDRTDAERMRPGMRFRGTVETGRVPRALLVPAEAVFATARGPVVHRRTATGVTTAAVTLGRRNQQMVEIVGGLAEDDQVSRRDPRREDAK